MESLEEIEGWAGRRLPEPYRAFLGAHEDDLPVGELVVLFGRAGFLDASEACRVKEHAPGCVAVGDDSGGRVVLLALGSGRLGLVDAGDMDPAGARPLAEDFGRWLDGGCGLGDPPEPAHPGGDEHPDSIDVYLLRPPGGGLQGLARVLELLDLSVPVSEYRAILSGTPHRLARAADYLRYGWRCAEHNLKDPCLGATAVDRPDRPVPLLPRRQPPAPPRQPPPPETWLS